MPAGVIDRDLGWKKFKKSILKVASRPVAIRVGVQGDDKASGGASLVNIATVHEFGSTDGVIPQRSFIRSTFDSNLRKYERLVDAMTKSVLLNNTTAERSLGLIGMKFVADVKATIRAGIDPPLAESTLKARMSKVEALAGNKNQSAATAAADNPTTPGTVIPLIDTGHLIASIRSVVER